MPKASIVQKIKAHLRSVTDLTLLVLKGHLLVEEQINWALSEVMPNPAALDDARLTFSQRIKLLRALNSNEIVDRALGFAERLNTMRNMLAHQLEPAGLEESVKKFVTEVAASMPVQRFEVQGTPNLHVAMCVAYICGLLYAFRHATRIVQSHISAENGG